jgi:hypothetical protein
MAAIPIKSFGGISPKVPARYLPDTAAQVANNCIVFNGSLQPLRNVGATVATLTKVGTPTTIYRFGQDIISSSEHWFHWTTDVNVCRSQIPGDTSEWTFYTGDGAPKATYAAIALSGTNYPSVSRPLGLPAPTTAAILTLGGAPVDATAIPETRVYTYTLVNKESGFDFESAPAPASTSIDVKVGQTVTLSSFDAVPSGYAVTHRRIYRSVSGTYLFVAEITAATASYTDSVLAEDLGEEIPSLSWLPPPAALRGLTNLPNGIMAGFVGRDVYFCDPYRPHAWPVAYNQTIDFPVVGLGRMDTTLAVLTTGTPYFMQGSHPDSMVVVKSDLDQACAAKRSIVSANGVVMYASPDGLVMLSPGGSKLVSESAFTYAQWQELFNPPSIHAYMHDRKYVAFYDNGTTTGGFIFDLLTGQFTLHSVYATAGYTDLVNDKLFLAFADRTIKVWQAGTPLSYIWTSKKFTMPYEMTYACSQVEAEAYPVTAKYYVDGLLVHTKTVTNRNPFRLPVVVGRDWEFRIEGNTEVFSVATAQSMQEIAGV